MAINPWLRIFPPFAGGYFLSYLLRNANAVASPELSRELGLTAADLGLLTSAYLLAFALFQLPLGILLDRYGPRRVEGGLLLVAAAGCAFFASGHGLSALTLARALIGLGLSACLMASFKAFSLWFATERLPSVNAAIMAAGGLGALAASSPLSALLPMLGWRGVFLLLAALCLMTAALLLTTPERPMGVAQQKLSAQIEGLFTIVRSRAYWRFAPQTTLLVGGFMALQGLWALPYMVEVDGLSRTAAAHVLSLTAAGMIAGFVTVAVSVQPLKARGFPPDRLLAVGVGLGLAATAGIVLGAAPPMALWPILGVVFSVGNLAYALLSAQFPLELAGRANTALNLGAFLGAFLIQWAFGAAIEALAAAEISRPSAYRLTLAALLAMQTLAWLWYLRRTK